jgi:clan AA aspartic protease
MITGRFHDHFPRVTLDLPGVSGPLSVEFIVDTGFDGDLILPTHFLRQLEAQPLYNTVRSLADGTLRECPVYEIEIEWGEEIRIVEVLGLERNPLLGTTLMEGCQLNIDLTEGGEVNIELPY